MTIRPVLELNFHIVLSASSIHGQDSSAAITGYGENQEVCEQMKKILEFTSPEDDEMFKLCEDGPRLKWALDEFDNWLRSELKYNDARTEVERKVLQECRDKLREFLNEDA